MIERIPKRLRPFASLLIFAVGGLFVWRMFPEHGFEGLMLFAWGASTGQLQEQLNPRKKENKDGGPYLPWDEMDAGDRLGYFFPTIIGGVIGTLILVAAITASHSEMQWEMIGGSLAIVGLSAGAAYKKWNDRYLE